ncbi:metallophosphoesterase [Rhizobium rhizosphaerae]|uniref:Metallophosphoesterase n=1 Tax=Xaviernesmea rhizosphaerae TaxID=1672749 RepID=A0A1Q9AF96_9HYPH|nr:metallophosphoesterase [Xaviernesmea rhizosphaerae]OLP53608.1 metallophosphoesterase [Xaviernesmea rhizosphaerae]
MIVRRNFLRLAAGFLFASLSTTSYAVGVEPMLRMKTVTYRPRLPNWPDGLRLRLVLLADFHACDPWMSAARIASIAEKANSLQGDMVLLLGDFLSGMRLCTGHVPPEDWAAALSGLSAPLGVHAILGNHDWADDHEAMARGKGPLLAQRALEGIGVPVYDNRAVSFEKDGHRFWLAGLGDQIGPLRPMDDLPGTLAQVSDDAPVILMAHEPDIFPGVPARVAITLSGHTHGGQIRLFGRSPFVPSRFGSRYIRGHIIEGGRHLIVSAGLGMSGIPVRFGAPPEIVVVELGGDAAA